jgi:predicted DNA-binding transcriptional regulator YafY
MQAKRRVGRPSSPPLSDALIQMAVAFVRQASKPVSQRELARHLGVDRRVVMKYVASRQKLAVERVYERPNGNPAGFAAVVVR